MNRIAQNLTGHVLHPAMHQKILLRAAELVAQGWTRGTAARDVGGRKLRSTAPTATAWCVVGAVDRALYELLNIEVYDLLGLDVAGYDTAPCPAGILRELRRPLRRVLGAANVAAWNDRVCPGPAAAEQFLRDAAARAGRDSDDAAAPDPGERGRFPSPE